ncbi:MAG: NADH-quinone oxidoreductase subunit D [Bacteroidia bacterium]|nr:NADH-quinone oxidoreductase subunit D [Bacteroidia bacterium]
MVLNMGPQHPSTHGVLRLELVTDGEVVVEVVPHLGYMHRCFEKHAEALPYDQLIPFVDRMDYLAAMNSEHCYAMGLERMCGLTGKLPKRVEYVRVLVAELNRIASHLLAIGTFGMDLGTVSPFLWCMRDREHILNLLEWASGARMLYNYIWVGGLFYDVPLEFEARVLEFCDYFAPKLDELDIALTTNAIFVERTAGVGVLPLPVAVNYGITGPMLRACGLAYDLRRVDGYSVYPELDFEVPFATEGAGPGAVGDTWWRYQIRALELRQSLAIVRQAAGRLQRDHARTPDFDPRALCPKKIRPEALEYYVRAENPRGELGYYIVAQPKKDIPLRIKARGPSFCNLSVLPELCKGVLVADLVAILGSIDIVLCEVDR